MSRIEGSAFVPIVMVGAGGAAAMRGPGLTYVRIGEFAWSRIEPAPGAFEWGWLDRAITVLGQAVLGDGATARPGELGPRHPRPAPGMVRLWTWEAFAHGAAVVSFFRWRQAPFAQEQMHAGLLRPDKSRAEAWPEIEQLGAELARVDDLPAPRAADGSWPLAPGANAADSTALPGQPPVCYWPGFQRRLALGLVMEHRP